MSLVQAQQIRFRCAIAAIRTAEKIRVYTQDTSSGIREIAYEDGRWSGGSEKETIARGILGTPIAAISRDIDQMIHVFFIAEGNMVKEVCRDSSGRWHDGQLSKLAIKVAPYSMLSACLLAREAEHHMRVYVQMMDNTIQEYGCNDKQNTWSKMTNIGRALPGTGMACASFHTSSLHIRVYYQNEDMDIVEKSFSDGKGWGEGELSIKQALPRTDLAITAFGDGERRLYYVDRGNYMKEMSYSSEGWRKGSLDQPCVPGSQVAAICRGRHRDRNICVYFQRGKYVTALTEWKWEDGKWEEGREALPPA